MCLYNEDEISKKSNSEEVFGRQFNKFVMTYTQSRPLLSHMLSGRMSLSVKHANNFFPALSPLTRSSIHPDVCSK